MKIALIPIDNRPVCYSLIKEIASIDTSLELFLPDRALLGGLSSTARVNEILNWLDSLEKVDAIVVSLDTIAYGGLISSRRCKDKSDEIKSRLETFKSKCENKSDKIYAFSSIMRISNNNVNEEEKEYWNEYGEKIFAYSYNFHKNGYENDDIPSDILSDYLATRHRNFGINKMYVQWLDEGFFDTLIFSKDDCAEYGLNVLESEILKRMIKEKTLLATKKPAFVKTGADEIPLSLFARAISEYNEQMPKISTKFLAPEFKDLISNYEDISIEQSVQSQIELAGCEITDNNESDMNLIINNFEEKQGEIVMGVKTQPFIGDFDLPRKPFMVADVRFANGADNKFVEKLLKKDLSSDFYGYSAWNTSANTMGSLICAGVVRFFAKKYNEKAFKKLQLTRFLDDWAYQANVRQELKKTTPNSISSRWLGLQRPDVRKLKKLMLPFEKKLNKIFTIGTNIKYYFPWRRFFEVGIIVK